MGKETSKGSTVNEAVENGHANQQSAMDVGKLALYVFWFPFFAFSSVSMVLLNKYCAHSFQLPYSLLGFQNSMTIVLNLIGVATGVFSVKAFTAAQFKMFVLPTFLFVGMLVTSLYGLPYVSVATTVIFRAVSTCFVAVGDYLFFGKRFVREETVCMAFVVVGAVVYAANDLTYDSTGYLWMLANTAMFVSSQLYEKYAVVALDQSAVGISCIQNALSLPIIVVMGSIMQEGPLQQLQKTNGWTRFAIGMTGICGCSLSICYMSLSKFASATSISLAGNFNKLLSILCGALVFHNPLGPLQACGLATSMFATMAFANKGQIPAAVAGSRRNAVISALVLLMIITVSVQFLGGGKRRLDDIGTRIKGKAMAFGRRAVQPFAWKNTSRSRELLDVIRTKMRRIGVLSQEVLEAEEELRALAAAAEAAMSQRANASLFHSTDIKSMDKHTATTSESAAGVWQEEQSHS